MQGKVFRSFLSMHKTCPVCDLKFERETGYFLNSMFVAYTAGFLVLAPSAFLMGWLDVSILTFTLVLSLEAIVLWPLLFRYSRVIWLHIDQVLDPRKAASEETVRDA
jgi:uncharacterized protein (DUF983 family)